MTATEPRQWFIFGVYPVTGLVDVSDGETVAYPKSIGPGMTAAETWTGWVAMTVAERKAFVSTLVGLGLVSLRQAAALTVTP